MHDDLPATHKLDTPPHDHTTSHFSQRELFLEYLSDPSLTHHLTIITMLEQYQEKPYLIDPILSQSLSLLTHHISTHITTLATSLRSTITSFFDLLILESDPPPRLIQPCPQLPTSSIATMVTIDVIMAIIIEPTITLQRAAAIFYTFCKVRKLKFILRFLNPPPHLLDQIFLVLPLITSSTLNNIVGEFNPSHSMCDMPSEMMMIMPIPQTSAQIINTLTHTLKIFTESIDWHTSYSLLAFASTSVLTPFPLHSFDLISSMYSPSQLRKICVGILNHIGFNKPLSSLSNLTLLTLPLPIRIYSVLVTLLPSPSTHLQTLAALTLGRLFSRPDLLLSSTGTDTTTITTTTTTTTKALITFTTPPLETNSTNPLIIPWHLYPSSLDLMQLISTVLSPQTDIKSILDPLILPFGSHFTISLADPSYTFPTFSNGVLITVATYLDQIQGRSQISLSQASTLTKNIQSPPPSLNPITQSLIDILITLPAQTLLPSSDSQPVPSQCSVSPGNDRERIATIRDIGGGFGILLRGLPLNAQESCIDLLTQRTGQIPIIITPHVNSNSIPQSLDLVRKPSPLWIQSSSTSTKKIWIKAMRRLLTILFITEQNFLYPSQITAIGPSARTTPAMITTTTQFNSVTQLLFLNLHDNSWGLRWSAAKGLGLILQQLTTKSNHSPVIPALGYDLYSETFFPSYKINLTHTILTNLLTQARYALQNQLTDASIGCLLALSEALRLQLIPISQIIPTIELLLLSILYPIRQTSLATTNTSAPTLIREAACLGLYSLSRGTPWISLLKAVEFWNARAKNLTSTKGQPQLIGRCTSIGNLILTIYDNLLLTCFVDVEKSVRCAASAALQEFVGRFYHPFSIYPHHHRDNIHNDTNDGNTDNSTTPPQSLTSEPPNLYILSHNPFTSTFQYEIGLIMHHIHDNLFNSQQHRYQPCPTHLLQRFHIINSNSSVPPPWITDFHIAALDALVQFDYRTTIQLSLSQTFVYFPQEEIRSILTSALKGDDYKKNGLALSQSPIQILCTKLVWIMQYHPHLIPSLLFFSWTRYLPSQHFPIRILGHLIFSSLLLFFTPHLIPQSIPILTRHSFRILCDHWLSVCLDFEDPQPTHLEVKLTIITAVNHGLLKIFPLRDGEEEEASSEFRRSYVNTWYHTLLQTPWNFIHLLSPQPSSSSPSHILVQAQQGVCRPQTIKLSQQTNWLTLRTQLLYLISSLLDLVHLVQRITISFPHSSLADFTTISTPLKHHISYFLHIALTLFNHHHTLIQTLAVSIFLKIDQLSDIIIIIDGSTPSITTTLWKEHFLFYTLYRITPILSHLGDLATQSSTSPIPSSTQQPLNEFFMIPPLPPIHQIPSLPLLEIIGWTKPIQTSQVSPAPRLSRFKSKVTPDSGVSPPPPLPFCASPQLFMVGQLHLRNINHPFEEKGIILQHHLEWLQYLGSLVMISSQPPTELSHAKMIIQHQSHQKHQHPFRSHLLNPTVLFEQSTSMNESNIRVPKHIHQDLSISSKSTTTSSSTSPPYDLQAILRLFIALLQINCKMMKSQSCNSLLKLIALCLAHPATTQCIITRTLSMQLLGELVCVDPIINTQHLAAGTSGFRSDHNMLFDLPNEARSSLTRLLSPPKSFITPSTSIITNIIDTTLTPTPSSKSPSDLARTWVNLAPLPLFPSTSPTQLPTPLIFIELACAVLTMNTFDLATPSLTSLSPHHALLMGLSTLLSIWSNLFLPDASSQNETKEKLAGILLDLCFTHIHSLFPIVKRLCNRIIVILALVYTPTTITSTLDPFEKVLGIIKKWIGTQLQLRLSLVSPQSSSHSHGITTFRPIDAIQEALSNFLPYPSQGKNDLLGLTHHSLTWSDYLPPQLVPFSPPYISRQLCPQISQYHSHSPDHLPNLNELAHLLEGLMIFDTNNSFTGDHQAELHYVRFILALFLTIPSSPFTNPFTIPTLLKGYFLYKPLPLSLTLSPRYKFGYLSAIVPSLDSVELSLLLSLVLDITSSSSSTTSIASPAFSFPQQQQQKQEQPPDTLTVLISPFILICIGLVYKHNNQHSSDYHQLLNFIKVIHATFISMALPTHQFSHPNYSFDYQIQSGWFIEPPPTLPPLTSLPNITHCQRQLLLNQGIKNLAMTPFTSIFPCILAFLSNLSSYSPRLNSSLLQTLITTLISPSLRILLKHVPLSQSESTGITTLLTTSLLTTSTPASSLSSSSNIEPPFATTTHCPLIFSKALFDRANNILIQTPQWRKIEILATHLSQLSVRFLWSKHLSLPWLHVSIPFLNSTACNSNSTTPINNSNTSNSV